MGSLGAGVDNSTLGDVLKGTGGSNNILHRNYYSDQVTSSGIKIYQFSGNGYELSNAIVRRELPFVIGSCFTTMAAMLKIW